MSWTYFKDGFKISKFFGPDGEFLYYYCDIIDYTYDENEDTYIFIDLLVDVKFYPGNKIEFLDFDELQEAYNNGMISDDYLIKAISTVTKVAQIIKNGEIEKYCC